MKLADMNENLLKELLETVILLRKNNIEVWVYGSFAVSLHAGPWIKDHDDVDLAFKTYDEYKKAIEIILTKGYKIGDEATFLGKHHNQREWNTVVYSPNGAKFDFSYIRDEFTTDYRSAKVIIKNNCSLNIFSLPELLRCYTEYGEKSDDMMKVIHIKNML